MFCWYIWWCVCAVKFSLQTLPVHLFQTKFDRSSKHVKYTTCAISAYHHWGARVAQWVRSLDLTAHTSLSPIRRGFAPRFVSYKKGCTRLAAASDKVYQLLAQGRWFSPGTPASSTTKTGRHDIAGILLKHQNSNSNSNSYHH
jgi:hypothetical protein